MVQVVPVARKKKVVKRKKKFKRFQSNRFMRVGESWRKPRGIDCRIRRRFRGSIPMVNAGYGSNKKTRHVLPNGLYKFQVHNVAELELLLMHNRKYCAEIAANVSARKRALIVARAEQLRIKVSNGNAKLRAEESE
jgi:large subunit ribosomal protein L32e